MVEAIFSLIARILTWTFAIGMAGCIVVIPVVAYKLFSVLFEKDQPGET